MWYKQLSLDVPHRGNTCNQTDIDTHNNGTLTRKNEKEFSGRRDYLIFETGMIIKKKNTADTHTTLKPSCMGRWAPVQGPQLFQLTLLQTVSCMKMKLGPHHYKQRRCRSSHTKKWKKKRFAYLIRQTTTTTKELWYSLSVIQAIASQTYWVENTCNYIENFTAKRHRVKKARLQFKDQEMTEHLLQNPLLRQFGVGLNPDV